MALVASTSDAPRTVFDKAGEHYRAGQFAEALSDYQSIDPESLRSAAPELLSNLAAAQYKLGRYEEARELWVRCASLRDAAFESGVRFNLGNCSYQEALTLLNAPQAADGAQSSPPPTAKMIELLDRAIEQYRDSLRLDPVRTDARANIELAQQLKKRLEEAAQSQPQSQPQTQPSSQPDDKQENQGNASQPSSQPGDGEGSSDSQPSSRPDSQPSDKSKSKDGRQGDDESQDPQEPDEQQPAPESQPSTRPSPQPSSESQPSEAGQERPENAVEIDMSKQEAERLLQRVRDAEQKRRAALRAREMGRQRPVEKDW